LAKLARSTWVESLFSRFEQTSHRAGGFYVKNSKNHFGKVGEARVFWSVGIG
jgi:hypothetical protein